MDPEDPKLHYAFEKKYTQKNRYDNFSIQQGLLPQREYYNVAMPDYMVLSYDFIVWTHYIEQMNKLVERINWSAGSYWGEPNKMRFRTNIDSYTDTTEVTDRDRVVKTEFSVTLRGYLIPEAYNELVGPHITNKHLTPKRIIMQPEVDVPVAALMSELAGAEAFPDAAQIAAGGTQPVILSEQFTLSSGTGITLTNDGEPFDGSFAITHEISIPQEIAIDSNVQFNAVTASSILLGSNTFTQTGVDSSFSVTGSLVTSGDLTVSGNTNILGTLTAQEFHTEYISGSIIFTSGSTKFGDTLDDTHYFTGSMYVTGSWGINGSNDITKITNDVTLAESSTTSLATENAIKTYIDVTVANTDSRLQYLRKQYVKISTTLVGNSTASFSAVTASSPAAVPGLEALTSTTEHDFLFFINGQYMEHDALEIQQANGAFYLKVDTDSIGYVLESDDEILAWGKFDS